MIGFCFFLEFANTRGVKHMECREISDCLNSSAESVLGDISHI